jgi:hypothetical protein
MTDTFLALAERSSAIIEISYRKGGLEKSSPPFFSVITIIRIGFCWENIDGGKKWHVAS